MNPPESTIEEHEILDLLTALVDKSLVAYDESTGRYRLLETVRQYGRDRLVESGDGERWRNRHLGHFIDLVERADPSFSGPDHAAWIDRLERERDNFRSALEWSSAGVSDPADSLRLAGTLWRFWFLRGYLTEGRDLLDGLLDLCPVAGDTISWARALIGAGMLALAHGDYSVSRSRLQQSLSISRKLCYGFGIASALNDLGLVAHALAEYTTARNYFEQGLATFREIGDRWGCALVMEGLGTVAYDQGDIETAETMYSESLSIFRELGDERGMAVLLGNLGRVAYERKDYVTARSLLGESLVTNRGSGYRTWHASNLSDLGRIELAEGNHAAALAQCRESLAIRREIRDRSGIAASLRDLAAVFIARGKPEPATRLIGAADSLSEEIGAQLAPNELPRYESQLAAARTALTNDAAFDAAWQDGRAMTMEQAVDYALEASRDA